MFENVKASITNGVGNSIYGRIIGSHIFDADNINIPVAIKNSNDQIINAVIDSIRVSATEINEQDENDNVKFNFVLRNTGFPKIELNGVYYNQHRTVICDNPEFECLINDRRVKCDLYCILILV